MKIYCSNFAVRGLLKSFELWKKKRPVRRKKRAEKDKNKPQTETTPPVYFKKKKRYYFWMVSAPQPAHLQAGTVWPENVHTAVSK